MPKPPPKLPAPFLRRLSIKVGDPASPGAYPYNIPLLNSGNLDISFDSPVTIFAGENGAGKSTLLEAIAATSGFNPEGGSSSHYFRTEDNQVNPVNVRLSWLPKIRKGFFFRAESFFNFSTYIDTLAREDQSIWQGYGGKSLHARSHGESFLALFESRFQRSTNCLFILDEPEAALSPTNQLRFLKIIRDIERGNNQVIMASHSPILMAYPGAALMLLDDAGTHPLDFNQSSQFLLWREFVKRPHELVAEILEDD